MKDVLTSLEERGYLPFPVLFPSPPSLAAASLVLSPSTVLPEQFFNLPSNLYKGETALMYAVLEDACNCFVQQFLDHRLRVRRLAEEAEGWLFSDDDLWPFSFVNICMFLGLNPEYVRKGLRQWRQSRPTQIRRRKQHAVSRTRSLSTAA